MKLSTGANHIPQVKEIKMSADRLCNILIIVTLIVMAALTIQQATGVAAVAKAASAFSSKTEPAPAQCLLSSPHQSITASYEMLGAHCGPRKKILDACIK
jgi:hypothetical protein